MEGTDFLSNGSSSAREVAPSASTALGSRAFSRHHAAREAP